MIVAHEVTNVGHDRDQLSSMAHQACDAIGLNKLTVLADRGYFKGEEIFECEQAGIKTLVPKPQTSNNKAPVPVYQTVLSRPPPSNSLTSSLQTSFSHTLGRKLTLISQIKSED